MRDLKAFGMDLHWLGYGGYRERHAPGFWAPWQIRYPHLHPVPEGGSGLPGAQGCMAWAASVGEQLATLGWADFHGWWLACGTGTSLAGLVLAEAGQRPVYGVLAVPQDHGVAQQVESIVGRRAFAVRFMNCSTAAVVVSPGSMPNSPSSSKPRRPSNWSRCTPAKP